MLKMIRLCCALPALMLAHNVYAADSAPVDLVNAQETAAASGEAPAVDSALSESMQSPTVEKNTFKQPSGKSKRGKASSKSTSDHAGIIPANDNNYTIQAGDVLQITVWKEADMDKETLVLPDGTVSFPLIGSFKAEGLTPAQVQSTVRGKLQSYIPDASVTVVVKAALGHSVSVLGQVAKPGEIVMTHPLTVLQALSQAGGLTAFASEGRIKVLRNVAGKQEAIEVPYDDIAEGQNLDKNIMLLPGDTIIVPTAGLF